MKKELIKIRGANEHNLKNIDLDIPRDELIVITGVSGSGKSSLAFDTIFAEGQRRYMESLSSYARQFLGQMEKPKVTSIEGLSPAISIDQKSTNRNPRSTVGTVTEIYDYLRLLYARIGIPHCPNCGKEIKKQTVDEIVDSIMKLESGTKIQLLAYVVRGKKGRHEKVIESAKKSGYSRVRIDGNEYTLDEEISLDKNIKHNIEIIVDRLIIKEGIDPKEAIKMVTFNPAEHYGLNCGAIEEGRIANFSLVDDLTNLNISKVWVHGELVVDEGEVLFEVEPPEIINNFVLDEVTPENFDVIMEMDYVSSLMDESTNVYAIEAYDGDLITGKVEETLFIKNKVIQPNLKKDVIKIAVVNRYGGGNITNGFIKGFNLKKGAFAASVAHDSHNIVVIGTNSEDMAYAVNLIRENKGGFAVVSKEDGIEDTLELPIAGLMSDRDLDYVSAKLIALHDLVHDLGCELYAPFMTLAFMALLVIPNFKISDLGLFDYENFGFTDLIKQYLI